MPSSSASPYAPSAIITPDQCAAWLALPKRQLTRLGVPSLRFGHRTRRYAVRTVLKWLAQQQRKRKRRKARR